jgi:[ribosomal protein S5]-alanine N-acetyltransferase
VIVDGDVVGSAELKLHGPSTGEIAYVVHPKLWGHGIATAAARELLRIGFGEHGRHHIFGTCDPRNVASAAVRATDRCAVPSANSRPPLVTVQS